MCKKKKKTSTSQQNGHVESEMSPTIPPLDGHYNNHFLRAHCVLGIELGAAEMKPSKILPIFLCCLQSSNNQITLSCMDIATVL